MEHTIINPEPGDPRRLQPPFISRSKADAAEPSPRSAPPSLKKRVRLAWHFFARPSTRQALHWGVSAAVSIVLLAASMFIFLALMGGGPRPPDGDGLSRVFIGWTMAAGWVVGLFLNVVGLFIAIEMTVLARKTGGRNRVIASVVLMAAQVAMFVGYFVIAARALG